MYDFFVDLFYGNKCSQNKVLRKQSWRHSSIDCRDMMDCYLYGKGEQFREQ